MTTSAHGARPPSVLAWTAAFGTGFGWVEAVVVIYLRELYYPNGSLFPLREMPARIAVIEVLREAATLLMLMAFACAVARKGWGRFGIFALAFGVWDLVYYAGLHFALGWPATLGDWDILFLIPGIWTSPVWAPCLVSVLLIACGAFLYTRDERNLIPPPLPRHWLLAFASLTAILAAFLSNHDLVTHGGVPTDFPLIVFLPAVLLAVATFADLLRRGEHA